MSELNLSRMIALRGGFSFEASGKYLQEWRAQERLILVFVSSTFTDTHEERNTLIESIIPDVRQRFRHVIIKLVDMRWGVRDENTLDHKTWLVCLRELQRCRELSTGIFFMSLQSNKYGYTPLPKTIESSAFESHLVTHPPSAEIETLLRDWYSLDENSRVGNYFLCNLERMNDDSFWKDALPKLCAYFDGLPFDPNRPELLINRSVTEWEVKTAVGHEARDASCTDLCWLRRDFKGGVPKSADRCWDFDDTLDDPKKASCLQDLLGYMHASIPADRIWTFDEATFDQYKNKETEWTDQLEKWKQCCLERLIESAEREQGIAIDWENDACGLGLPGSEAAEFLHHSSLAALKVSDFVGREELVQQAMQTIRESTAANSETVVASVAAAATPTAVGVAASAVSVENFSGVCLCIAGLSGAGKTALMAKVADALYRAKQAEGKDVIVLIRFCGTSPESSSGLLLVRSLCRQIHLLLGHPMQQDWTSILLMDYETAVEHFQSLVQEYPLNIFIDSADQLTDENLARSRLSFLRGIRPHEHGCIVVSALLDGTNYSYGCETLLREAQVPRIMVGQTVTISAQSVITQPITAAATTAVVTGAATTAATSTGVAAAATGATAAAATAGAEAQEACSILQSLLAASGRSLSPAQLAYVSRQIEVEPSALYVRLALRVVVKWTSSDSTLKLAGGVRNLVNQIFEELERSYGAELVRAAFGFVTFAVAGVSDSEMVDLLTLHPGVMAAVNQYKKSLSLPPHVWLRLFGEMEGLVTEREGGCLCWFHRQLWEAAEQRYAADKQSLHATMGRYYGNLADPTTRVSCQRLVTAREASLGASSSFSSASSTSSTGPSSVEPATVWLPNSVVNKRRCREAAHHLILSGLYNLAKAELCCLEAVQARAKCGEIFAALRQLSELSKKLPGDERVEHYLIWIRQEATGMVALPQTHVFTTGLAQAAESVVRQDCMCLLSEPAWKPAALDNGAAWLRSRMLGISRGFDPTFNILMGHSGGVMSVSFSRSGSQVISGSRDKTACIWDASSGVLLHCLEHAGEVSSVSFSPDGKQVACGSLDKTIYMWNATSGRLLSCLDGHSGSVYSVSYSPDGSRVASGSRDKSVRIWDASSGELLKCLEGHTDWVKSVAFSSDGGQVASGSYDHSIQIWDALSGALLQRLQGHTGWVSAVVFSPDGNEVISGSFDKNVCIWDVSSGRLVKCLEGHTDSIWSVSINPDGTEVASASMDKNILIWNVSSGEKLMCLDGHSDLVSTVAYSPDGSRVVSGSRDNGVRIWNASSAGESNRLVEYHSDGVGSVAFSPDGSHIVSGSGDHSVRVWDACSGALIQCLEGHSDEVGAVAFSPDSRQVVSGSDDQTLRIWDLSAGTLVMCIEGHLGWVSSVAFSPNGTRLVSASYDKNVCIWDASSGGLLWRLTGHSEAVLSVSFSPDSCLVASGGRDKSVRIWNASSGELIDRLEHLDAVSAVLFSPDGKVLVTGSFDKGVRIWDASSHELKRNLTGHSDWVSSVSVNADCSLIASAGGDKSIKIWDATTGVLLKCLQGHSDEISSVSFSPDGSDRVVSASYDKSVRIWDCWLHV